MCAETCKHGSERGTRHALWANGLSSTRVSGMSYGEQDIQFAMWGTHLRRDTVIPQWFQASKAAAASDGHAVHC